MSRSRKKKPIFGVTSAVSEADDKRLWHKRWRAKQRAQLLTGEAEVTPVHKNAVSSVWDMRKEGKYYRGKVPAKWMRK